MLKLCLIILMPTLLIPFEYVGVFKDLFSFLVHILYVLYPVNRMPRLVQIRFVNVMNKLLWTKLDFAHALLIQLITQVTMFASVILDIISPK